jgi:histidyl-tRNA synthetase
VCGGGRYDGLVQQLGGAATACIGWAMGLERLVLLLESHGIPPGAAADLYVVSQGAAAEALALQAARLLRQGAMRWSSISVGLALVNSSNGRLNPEPVGLC